VEELSAVSRDGHGWESFRGRNGKERSPVAQPWAGGERRAGVGCDRFREKQLRGARLPSVNKFEQKHLM